jgi:hypothetical protein
MPGHRVRPFATESQQAGQAAVGPSVTVWGVSDGLSRIVGLERVQHRTLQVGRQQGGIDYVVLTLMLRQQQVAMLNDRMLYRALNLCSQTTFAVETLNRGAVRQPMSDQLVEGVINVMAEQGFALRLHG